MMTAAEDPRQALAERLREARKLAGLSQGKVAEMLDMHRPTITEIEKGNRKVSAEEISKFAEIYDVTGEGNFEGHSILNRLNDLALRDEATEARLAADREKLLAARATGAGVSFNFGRILTAVGVLGAGAITAAFNDDYARAGSITPLIYAVGMIVILFAPDTTKRRLED